MKDEMNEKTVQEDIELTGEDNAIDSELEDVEQNSNDKIKTLRAKLKVCEQERLEHLENLQRAKADFLNGKRRLEEESGRDKEKAVNAHIKKLLPMSDSFHMAMIDKQAWESVDEQWRLGVENINNQLQKILDSYGVYEIHPKGEIFDPNLHEAMTNVPVQDKSMHNKVVSVVQNGFMRKTEGEEFLLRPARVTIGEYKNN